MLTFETGSNGLIPLALVLIGAVVASAQSDEDKRERALREQGRAQRRAYRAKRVEEARELKREQTERRELLRYQARLIEGAKEALAAPKLAVRNRVHAEAVTAESTELTARAVGLSSPAARANMTRVFHSATLEAGEAFQNVRRGDAAGRLAASSAVPSIAYRHLPAAAAALDGRLLPTQQDAMRAAEVVDRAKIEDLTRIVAKTLGLKDSTSARLDSIRDFRRLVPKGDPLRAQIDAIPTRGPNDRPLTQAERNVLQAGLRLVNAGEKAGTAHLAVLGNDPGQVKTTGRNNPFDLILKETYQGAYREHQAKLTADTLRHLKGEPIEPRFQESLNRVARAWALSRAVFEAYRSLHALRGEALRRSGDPERRYAQKTRARLRRFYVDELRTKRIPELIAEARKQGIDLSASRQRLSRLSIMSTLSGLDGRDVKARAEKKLRPHVVANGLTFTDKNGRTRFLPFAGPAGQRLSQADRAPISRESKGASSRLEGLIPGSASRRRGVRR